MGGSKHAPNRLDRYRDIHETVMGQYRDRGFLLNDDLSFEPDGMGNFVLMGRIDFEHGLYIDVTKKLCILDGEDETATVRTFAYTYNAVLTGVGNILRYCSPHHDHHCFHHKHTYDVFRGDRTGTVTKEDAENWPTLGQVFEELYRWSCENLEDLQTASLSRPRANDS